MFNFFSFIYDNRVVLFYSILLLTLILNRRKFDVQGKIIFLYRTKFGITFINRFAKKNKELVKLLGLIGIGIGFVGLILISVLIGKSFVDLFLKPDAPAAVQPVIPGVNIPGSAFKIPLVMPWIALFIIVLIHEFSHGIVAAAHGLKIKNTGIVFFGPLMGAFVEPDEEKLVKENDVVQYSIFAAGPFSNILLAGLIILVMIFAINPGINALSEEQGVYFEKVVNGSPAYMAGLDENKTITLINGVEVLNVDSFIIELEKYNPNQTIIPSGEKDYEINLGVNPNDNSKAYVGVNGIKTQIEQRYEGFFGFFGYHFFRLFQQQLFWIYLLSLGIGLANLLPLGPVDGGRMLQTALRKITGSEAKADLIWGKIAYFTIVILLLLLFTPIVRSFL